MLGFVRSGPVLGMAEPSQSEQSLARANIRAGLSRGNLENYKAYSTIYIFNFNN